jgi:hypothetical protein
MDHTDAVNGHAVERYLLGEMAESEAENFELHFFECSLCSEELASGALLAENIKAVSQPEAVAPARSAKQTTTWWSRPLFAVPVFAALALACVVVYQAREIGVLNQPRALAAYTLRSESRGGENRVTLPPGSPYFAINLDLPDTSFARYRCVLYDDAGAVVFSVDSSAPAAGSPLSILIPARRARPGAYTLRIQGTRGSVTGPEIASYRLTL